MPGSMVPGSPAGASDDAGKSFPASFGRYVVLAPIGGGAMGMVHKAHDPAIDRVVAVKVMRAEVLEPSARDEYLERFRIEVRAAGRCQHPAIVAVYDFGEQEGSPYIVMEYVEGPTLSAMLKDAGADRRAVAPRLAAAMLQVLEGLDLAHSLGVIHRDIKPANILVTSDGRAKIADFGIARLDIASLTAVGGMVGTPSYMAPEQALGRKVDARADLFATAAILHEILLGRPPFAGGSLPETLLRLTGPDAADLGPLIGTPLGTVLARALQKDPDRRFASAFEFAGALRQAMAGVPVEEATLVLSPGLPGLGAGGTSGIGGSGAGFSTAARENFDAAFLQRLRDDLVRHMGPIADTLLRRAAAAAPNEEDLVRVCGQMIEPPQERAAFLRRHRCASSSAAPNAPSLARTVAGTSTQVGAGPQPFAVTREQEAKLTDALVLHLGPIGRVLVKRTLPQAKSAAELAEGLAGNISDPSEALVFRRKLRSILGG